MTITGVLLNLHIMFLSPVLHVSPTSEKSEAPSSCFNFGCPRCSHQMHREHPSLMITPELLSSAPKSVAAGLACVHTVEPIVLLSSRWPVYTSRSMSFHSETVFLLSPGVFSQRSVRHFHHLRSDWHHCFLTGLTRNSSILSSFILFSSLPT